MKKFYLTILLILIITSGRLTAFEPDLYPVKINFHSDRFSHSELIKLAEAREIIYDQSELKSVLVRLYQSLAEQGYPLAELDSLNYNNNNDIIDIYISSGKVIRVVESEIIGYNNDDIQGFYEEEVLSQESVFHKAESVLDQLNDSGYPFARISLKPGDIEENNDQISTQLDLDIEDGGFTRIRRVEFPGRKLTRPHLLRLESGFRRGDVFSHIRLQRAVNRLNRLSFIESTGDPIFEHAGSGLVNIHIPIEERRVNTVSGIISAAQGQEDPSGELKLKFGNILGTGRKLQLEWLNLDPTRRGIIISYREIWILSHPWHGMIGLEQWSEDTLGTSTCYRFGLEWEPADRLILSGSAVRENISGSDREQSEAVWLEGGVSFNRLDHEWNPGGGYSIQLLTATAVRSYNNNKVSDDLKRQRLFQTGVTSLSDHIIIFQHIGMDDISGSGVITEDLVRIGGTGSVRGYGEDIIRTRGAIWGNLELRWRPDKTSWLGVFNDLGYVYREDERIVARERYPISFGFTSGMVTRVGRLGLDIALAKGESVQNARLHVRLEAWF